jgi:hypothetical protein
MGSIAKNFVSRSLMLALFLSLGCLALPVSPAAQNYPQAVVLEHKVKETARALEQRQKHEVRAEKQAKAQRRVAGEFAILVVKAKSQHSTMNRWHKVHCGESKIKARGGVHKKRFHCWICF